METITCTFGPDASGKRCGKPAVTTFTGNRGEHFAECAEHDVSAIVAASKHDGSARVYRAFGVERRSDAAYSHASRDSRGTVRFHKSYDAARSAAGSSGDVTAV